MDPFDNLSPTGDSEDVPGSSVPEGSGADELWSMEWPSSAVADHLAEALFDYESPALHAVQDPSGVVDRLRETMSDSFNEILQCPGTVNDFSAYWDSLHVGQEWTAPKKMPQKPCQSHHTIWSLIQHLNDGHKWSRERIADFVEDLQKQGYNFTFPTPEEL